MGTVDVTERLDEVERLILAWDFPAARAEVQRVLDEPVLADDDRLTARRLLAEVLRELGELDTAYDLAEAVAAQAERRHGPAHPATVHAVAVLAAVRHDHDEWDEAERLYHRVLDSGADEDGPEPVARAVRLARVNLALLQRDRGETTLALAMLNAAYVIHRREYGAEDLDTIRIAAELAALLYATGDVLQSRRLFTLAHAAARARLGTRHPFTKAVEWELAAVEPPMPSAPISLAPPFPAPPPPPPAPARPTPAPTRPTPAPAPPASARVWPLLCLIVVLAGVFVGLLAWHHEGPPDPFAGRSAPPSPFVVQDLQLRDGGRELTVTWTALPVSVVVALSRGGDPATVLATVPPGTTEYVVRDVDPAAAYCVVLGPVDEAVSITPATSACTAGR
ncbi:tetratricopeptide repeat protein [Dactylosporangium sp. NPDC049140]|uniref:tetratricopeptide repeat protein n=1 Tax=Dactylosporangium sp. NPDC049140 TaxID=3155647 RepID=UPI0033C35F9B